MEIHASDGLHPDRRCRGLALSGARPRGLALVSGSDRDCLFRALAPPRYEKEVCAAHLSFCRMNSVAFLVIAIITLSGALAAAALPKLIHAALSLVIVFVGVAAYFFLLGAEFVGLVQVFVYIGAVAVLIVFTILLTRREVTGDRGFHWGGVIVALAVFAALLWIILNTTSLALPAPQFELLTVRQIGEALMTNYVWPLQCIGLLLTVALIGALILVLEEKN